MGCEYLAAALPTLTLGEATPYSLEEFVFSLQGQLASAEIEELKALLEIEPEPGEAPATATAFSARWLSLRTQLRNAVALARAKRLGVDAGRWLQPHAGWSGDVERIVADAFAASDPLAMEKALDEGKLQLLDEETVLEPFELAAVYAFALKLQIVERWSSMDDQTGKDRLEGYIDANT